MRNETLLRALQENMRKLTETGIDCAAKIAQLREKAEQARLGIEAIMMQQSKPHADRNGLPQRQRCCAIT